MQTAEGSLKMRFSFRPNQDKCGHPYLLPPCPPTPPPPCPPPPKKRKSCCAHTQVARPQRPIPARVIATPAALKAVVVVHQGHLLLLEGQAKIPGTRDVQVDNDMLLVSYFVVVQVALVHAYADIAFTLNSCCMHSHYV